MYRLSPGIRSGFALGVGRGWLDGWMIRFPLFWVPLGAIGNVSVVLKQWGGVL
jgi:hypothetical protein